MPKGPRGEKRPADAIGLAVMIGKFATGEIEDTRDPVKSAAAELGSLGGKKRAANMTPERRREIAQAAAKRWGHLRNDKFKLSLISKTRGDFTSYSSLLSDDSAISKTRPRCILSARAPTSLRNWKSLV